MQWWNNILDWFNSEDGSRIITTMVLPFVAILVAGIVGALIGRGSTKRLIRRQERQEKVAAILALIEAGHSAAHWSSLLGQEKDAAEHLIFQAETRLRLLPIAGSGLAADWAAHQLGDMKRNSAGYGFQAEQTFVEYRDGLIQWQEKPGRAKKLFAQDLAAWKYDENADEKALIESQRRWEQEQDREPHTAVIPPTASKSK